jgi:hypothetical protein
MVFMAIRRQAAAHSKPGSKGKRKPTSRHAASKRAAERRAAEKRAAENHGAKHSAKKHKRRARHKSVHHSHKPTHAVSTIGIRSPAGAGSNAGQYGSPGGATPIVSSTPPAPSSEPPPFDQQPATEANVRRLLWRAGFGPMSGEIQAFVGQPLQQVVYSLTRPSGSAVLRGPEPVDEDGNPLAPADAWGDDHSWWLDRMIRSDQQLVERMTFIWHDWFATSNGQVNSQQMMLNQNETFRSLALGSFYDLFNAVTVDPAMLIFLNGTSNSKWEPNENYAREMMELFSLGADRGAYTEDDVREMARALTGWTSDWSAELGEHNFRFEASRHDADTKTVFGQAGNWNYNDAVSLCVNHPLHASFFVTKLWGYFIPTEIDEATLASLQGIYTTSGFSIRAVVEAILQHTDFYNGPELVTPPVVFNAGLMRACGRYVDSTVWAWLSANAGQQLFYPPNVSGWDFTHWLDTSTAKARWDIANYVSAKRAINPWPNTGEPVYEVDEEPATAMQRALEFWGNPALTPESEACLAAFAQTCLTHTVTASWERSPYRAMRQNALRMLIATSPDLQVS